MTGQQCPNTFTSELSGSGTERDDEQAQIIIFPEIKFTCNFNVVGLTVIGRPQQNINIGQFNFPELQIWRQTVNKDDSRVIYHNVINNRRKIMMNRHSNACEPENSTQIAIGANVSLVGSGASNHKIVLVRCTLRFKMQLSVNSGDILGLQLPTKNSAAFEIYFSNSAMLSTKIIYFEQNSSASDLTDLSSIDTMTLPLQPRPLITLQSVQETKSESGIYTHAIILTRLRKLIL